MTEAHLVVAIDLDAWSRGAEVEQYARRRGVMLEEAIRLLVNSGLSHQSHDSWPAEWRCPDCGKLHYDLDPIRVCRGPQ